MEPGVQMVAPRARVRYGSDQSDFNFWKSFGKIVGKEQPNSRDGVVEGGGGWEWGG